MAVGNSVAVVGNVTRDPELRFTPTGAATASFGLAVNERWQNKTSGEWEEETSFFDVTLWREQAENAAESLTRGARVMVFGKLKQRTWEDKNDGGKRSKIEIVADEVGPSLRWATAEVTKAERREGAPAGARSGGRSTTSAPAYDPMQEPF